MSTELSEQLIGRMFVSNTPLKPHYDPGSTWFTSYNLTLEAPVVARDAELLCERGMLQRELFDRFHVCQRCDSLRLNVREECDKCHSADLNEEQYLHHFKCAHQGPEDEFRRGDKLICPKCRYELTHFGFDYDRPGSMVVCQSCGHAASDPAVGFVCIDCGSHVDGDVAEIRDVFSYQLTDQGKGFAEHGQSLLGSASHALRFADLPLELVVALNAAAKTYNEEQVPFTLASIFYRNEREVIAQHGARAFSKARDLLIDNLRTSLGDSGTIVRGQTQDYVLVPGLAPEGVTSDLDLLIVSAENPVRYEIGAAFHTFGPEDFA
jgi:hypothetical protein